MEGTRHFYSLYTYPFFCRKNQLKSPTSEVKSDVHTKEIDKNATAPNSDEKYLMDDYDLDTSTTETVSDFYL